MFMAGDKVSYRTIGAGTVKGVIVRRVWDSFYGQDMLEVRVTSRKNPTYPVGHVIYSFPGAFSARD